MRLATRRSATSRRSSSTTTARVAFTNETAVRFPVLSISSVLRGVGSVQTDNDGDIDLQPVTRASAFGLPGGAVSVPPRSSTTVWRLHERACADGCRFPGAQNAQMATPDNIPTRRDRRRQVLGQQSPEQWSFGIVQQLCSGPARCPPVSVSTFYATDFADLDKRQRPDACAIRSPASTRARSRTQVPSGTPVGSPARRRLAGGNGVTTTVTTSSVDDNDGLDPIVGLGAHNAREGVLERGHVLAGRSYPASLHGHRRLDASDRPLARLTATGAADVVTGAARAGQLHEPVIPQHGTVAHARPRIGRSRDAGTRALSVILAGGLVRSGPGSRTRPTSAARRSRAREPTERGRRRLSQSFSTPMRYVGGTHARPGIQPRASPTDVVGMDVS